MMLTRRRTRIVLRSWILSRPPAGRAPGTTVSTGSGSPVPRAGAGRHTASLAGGPVAVEAGLDLGRGGFPAVAERGDQGDSRAGRLVLEREGLDSVAAGWYALDASQVLQGVTRWRGELEQAERRQRQQLGPRPGLSARPAGLPVVLRLATVTGCQGRDRVFRIRSSPGCLLGSFQVTPDGPGLTAHQADPAPLQPATPRRSSHAL